MDLSLRQRPSSLAGRAAGTERGGSVQMGKLMLIHILLNSYPQIPAVCELRNESAPFGSAVLCGFSDV